jgi:hypothetical protein
MSPHKARKNRKKLYSFRPQSGKKEQVLALELVTQRPSRFMNSPIKQNIRADHHRLERT